MCLSDVIAGFVLHLTRKMGLRFGCNLVNVGVQRDGFTNHVFNVGLMKNRKEILWKESIVPNVTLNIS